MLIVLSPAKKLDYESETLGSPLERQPRLMADTEVLIRKARKLKSSDLRSMMGVSESIADLNVARFKAFETPFTGANARPAIDAFKGDVYLGLEAQSLTEDDRQFADRHIRILSGLYGLLRPLDLMQAYRLEMGVRFATPRGGNLYQFWGEKITDLLRKDADDAGADTLVNLASGEYFKSIKPKVLGLPVITPVFKDIKDGRARVVSFLAKKARGRMARFVIDNRIDQPSGLKEFDWDGYRFKPDESDETRWVFTRPQP